MWFFYSLFFAVWSAFATLIVKKEFKEIPALALTFILLLFGFIFSAILLLITSGIPEVTPIFYLFMFAAGGLDAVAFVSSFRAIKYSDISLIAPIASFGPVFTTIWAIFTLGEIPTLFKFVGIILVVFGAYLLNVSEIGKGIAAPFKKLFSNKGVLLFLFANMIWSITPIFQKKAIFETFPETPLYASITGMFFAIILLAPVAYKGAFKLINQLPKYYKWFIAYGAGTAFSQLAAYTAFSLANVGYVTTILRTQSIFTIILGGKVLKEKGFRERMLGAIVMIIGALILAL